MAGDLFSEKQRALDSAISRLNLRYPELVRKDAHAVFKHESLRDLIPTTGTFDGSNEQMFVFKGTIPANYKGNVYNIPVEVYLMAVHPYHPPVCFVRPTPDMIIKESQYVDKTGRVYQPYLHQWKYPSSDLVTFLELTVMLFSEHMPVFSRGPSQPTVQQPVSSYPSYPTTSPSYLGSSGIPPGGYGTGSGYSSAAANPPYPSYQPGRPAPPPPSFGTCSGNNANPPYPIYGSQSQNSSYPAAYPYPSNNTPYPKPASGYGTITEEHIKASLISAIEDKLKRKLRESIGCANAELQVVRNTKDDLLKGEQKIKSILERIEKEQAEMERLVVVYTQKKQELESVQKSLPKEDEFKIDDMIDVTMPLYRQLLRCYTEECALEDAIYYLSQALSRGVLDLEAYLKNVRSLSRQQFMLRATMLRCRKVAGLD